MKGLDFIVPVFVLSGMFLVACGQKQANDIVASASMDEIHAAMSKPVAQEQTSNTSDSSFKKGDVVPADLVCMVNDAYMGGNKQLEVPYEGKMYYGCCQMCQTRIPQDATVRVALDPYSLKQVDKAEAYIIIIGNSGEVAYFENEDNYQKFIAEGK